MKIKKGYEFNINLNALYKSLSNNSMLFIATYTEKYCFNLKNYQPKKITSSEVFVKLSVPFPITKKYIGSCRSIQFA